VLTLALPAAGQVRPANTGNLATADNAATAFWNPAGLTRLEKTELMTEAILVVSRSQFEVEPETTVDGGNGDDQTSLVAIPAIYVSKPIGERWRIGGSLNVPSGIGSDYGSDWAGRYITQESTLFSLGMSGGRFNRSMQHLLFWLITQEMVQMAGHRDLKLGIRTMSEHGS
jgi:long-subunit fatty acid transport protein